MNNLTTEKQDEKHDHGNAMETRSFEVVFFFQSIDTQCLIQKHVGAVQSICKINSFSQTLCNTRIITSFVGICLVIIC